MGRFSLGAGRLRGILTKHRVGAIRAPEQCFRFHAAGFGRTLRTAFGPKDRSGRQYTADSSGRLWPQHSCCPAGLFCERRWRRRHARERFDTEFMSVSRSRFVVGIWKHHHYRDPIPIAHRHRTRDGNQRSRNTIGQHRCCFCIGFSEHDHNLTCHDRDGQHGRSSRR